MGQDWIIDVLSDLRSFARKNEMPLLTAQLDEAVLAASVEIATRRERAANWPTHDPVQYDGYGKES
jgi:hypothetical protein